MDSAQKTLISFASVSQRLGNTLDRHVGRKTVESSRLDKIVVGSRTVLEALNKTFLLKDGNTDDRLADWLNRGEHQACLHTLNQMEEILNRKVEYGVKSLFKASRSTQTQDKIGEAIRLLQMRRGYFHFLLTAGIWWVSRQVCSECAIHHSTTRNRESGAQQPPPLTAQPDVFHINQALDGRGLTTATRSGNGNLSRVVQAGGIQGVNRM